jgi:hypothetical protein
MSSFSKIHLSIALTVIIAGCKDTDTGTDTGKPACLVVPGECEDTGETGSETGSEMNETGETGGEGPDALGPGECVFNPNENKIGKQYNCFGELHTSLDLVITGLFPTCEDLLDDDGCSADFYFDYEPQVVACCGDYDIALKSNFQEFCIYDLYEQVCRSLAHQLEYEVEQGHFGIYGNKGADLQQYVADNVESCFKAFNANNTATLPFVESHWAVPKKFGLLEDIVFHIEPNTRIDGVNNPLSGDEWLTCEGAGRMCRPRSLGTSSRPSASTAAPLTRSSSARSSGAAHFQPPLSRLRHSTRESPTTSARPLPRPRTWCR